MFCELEIDQKTFDYVSKYVQMWQQNCDADFCCMDQQIQADEIHWHLDQQKLQECDHTGKNLEVLHWVQENGESFRSYLNTIKLVFTVHHCNGGAWTDFTWEEFQHIQQRLNQIKNVCLDTILIEQRA